MIGDKSRLTWDTTKCEVIESILHTACDIALQFSKTNMNDAMCALNLKTENLNHLPLIHNNTISGWM